MATENLLVIDGTLQSTVDLRNSTLSGTTQGSTSCLGTGGSGQFLAVKLSTVTDRSILLSTVLGGLMYGILQNKPGVGQAAAVAIGGISKVVSGSSSIAAGMDLSVSSAGVLVPYSSGAGVARCARSIEAATAIGQIFSAAIYGVGVPSGSVA